MAAKSAGIILYRWVDKQLEIFLVHPGGPFWAKKDDGAWSIPKGLFDEDEEPLEAAKREFKEETGVAVDGDLVALGEFRQPSGKVILAWAVESDFDLGRFSSNMFELEWPPKSGNVQQYPEADRGGWFRPAVALQKILKGQMPIARALLDKLGVGDVPAMDAPPPRDADPQGSLF